MKHFFALLFFCAFANLSFVSAQTDSLLKVWNNAQLPDSARMKAVNTIINEVYFNKKPDSALFYSLLQYKMAEEKELESEISNALNNIGIAYFHLGKYDEALTYYEKGVTLSEKTGNKEKRAPLFNNIGRIYKNRGEFDKAIEHYKKANELFMELAELTQNDENKRIQFLKGAGNTLNNIGSVYDDKGDVEKALEYYNQGLELREKIGDKKGTSSSLNNIGIIYFTQGNHARAIEYWTKSLRIKDELGEKKGAAITLHNIGNIYNEEKDYEKALDFYNRSLKIREEIKDKDGIAFSLNMIGTIYGKKKEYDKALEMMNKSLAIREEMNSAHETGIVLGNIGDIYNNMEEADKALDYYSRSLQLVEKVGDKKHQAIALNGIGTVYFKKKDFGKAISYSEKALALAKEVKAAPEIRNAAEALFLAYNASGNFKKALEMYQLHIAMRDSILSDENHKEVMRNQFQYDYDKKEAVAKAEQEKKDALTAAELRRQKLVRNGFVGGFAVVLLFAVIFFTQRNRISKEKQRSEELLLNILPEEVADELKEKGSADAKLIDEVTVLFTDFKGFTTLSEKLSPHELVKDLNECFSAFDLIMEKYGMEKIKTIGDSYMAAGGLPTPNTTHASDAIKAAMEMRDFIAEGKKKKLENGQPYFEIRIGIHTGPVVAGIVGVKKFQYDIWGDTVNTAARMESSGEVGKVNISETTYQLAKEKFRCEFRGEIEAKGKGSIRMWFVNSII